MFYLGHISTEIFLQIWLSEGGENECSDTVIPQQFVNNYDIANYDIAM